MKITIDWLGDFVALTSSVDELCEQLTMSGLEVEHSEVFSIPVDGIVAARIIHTEAHPDSDHLTLCKVDAGTADMQSIVCGAPNAREGLVSLLALPGAILPGGVQVAATQVRGQVSSGMLCSARELGLGDDHGGIVELPDSIAVGTSLGALLVARDNLIELNLTPNRGDCLSMLGVAREIGALNAGRIRAFESTTVAAQSDRKFPITLAHAGCPRYVGRVIEDVDTAAQTPLWMRERLRRCGVRPISSVVDITNYVMLALGQPMHAFDLDVLRDGIHVRMSAPGERLLLLDGNTRELDTGCLVIADEAGPVALAGIMGGEASGVTGNTRSVFLESAFFDPVLIAQTARRLNIHTDASHRFERAVDPEGQARAVEYATRLVIDICGGRPGPVLQTELPGGLPDRTSIDFRPQRANAVLGMAIPEGEARSLFGRLGMTVVDEGAGTWRVGVPSHRSDLRIEVDLIEELVRLYGYSRIPASMPNARLSLTPTSGVQGVTDALRQHLTGAGYFEAITYSFVRHGDWQQFTGQEDALALSNPISRDMAVMRSSLWPGLINALVHNQKRQVSSLRLFELGLAFEQVGATLEQTPRLAGIAGGNCHPEQWGLVAREIDFYDVKQDVINLIEVAGYHRLTFSPCTIKGLHPGESARIEADGKCLGHVGKLHPKVLKHFEINGNPVVFELFLEPLGGGPKPSFTPFSKYPSVRRDLAVVVPESLSLAAIRSCVIKAGGEFLRDLQLFDVYRGQGIDSDKKSMALGLIFQAPSSTLTDNQVEAAVSEVIKHLSQELGASLRM